MKGTAKMKVGVISVSEENREVVEAIQRMKDETQPLVALLKIGAIAQDFDEHDDEHSKLALLTILRLCHGIIKTEIEKRQRDGTLGKMVDGVKLDTDGDDISSSFSASGGCGDPECDGCKEEAEKKDEKISAPSDTTRH